MLKSRPRMRLLHLDSSALGDHSVSRQLSAALVDAWRAANPTMVVTYRDLAADSLAHLSGEMLQAQPPNTDLTDRQLRERALTEALIDEFLSAEAVVIGAPMYNFSISSQLKAWIDRIVRAGRTFQYTETGPVGIAVGKQVVIISSRGGVYATPERTPLDFQEAYLRLVLGFVGVTDISIIRAEGLALGSGPREKAINSAYVELAALVHDAA